MLTSLDRPTVVRPVVVAAHPDDEVLGLASLLPPLADRILIVHLTDGAPEDLAFAARSGFPDNTSYAAARRLEAERAMALAGIPADRILALGFRDQQLAFCLEPAVRRLAELFRTARPDVVFTHCYEGGHPDHDSAAFVLHSVRAILRTRGNCFRLIEFSSYHASGSRLETSRFLPIPDIPHCCRTVTEETFPLKQRMLACFESQQHFLQQHCWDTECLREAPGYDFGRAPHAGPLYYEQAGLGLTGGAWRALASQAARSLGVAA